MHVLADDVQNDTLLISPQRRVSGRKEKNFKINKMKYR